MRIHRRAPRRNAPWGKIFAAAALQGMIFKGTRVVVDRHGANAWAYLTGVWPGEERPDRTSPKASA